ncbi:MAG: hypothetical protein ACMXYL_05795 [Candidatus Woesearchaeota archaeon]
MSGIKDKNIYGTLRDYVIEPARKHGLKAVATGALLMGSGCHTVHKAPEPEPCHPTTPEMVLYMPDGTGHSYEMRGGTHKVMGPVTPSHGVGTLELLAKGDGCNPISAVLNMNDDVNYARVDGAENPNLDKYAVSASTPRDDDRTEFPVSRSSTEPIINTNYSIGTLRVTDGDTTTEYNVILPVQYTPMQTDLNRRDDNLSRRDDNLRIKANELSANYMQMTPDGRLVSRTPAQVLEDLTSLQDYYKAILSSYARPGTDRNEIVFRGLTGGNSLSYGFVNEDMSALGRTESLERMAEYASRDFFNKDTYRQSLGR